VALLPLPTHGCLHLLLLRLLLLHLLLLLPEGKLVHHQVALACSTAAAERR
jgi:hypothetical protein